MTARPTAKARGAGGKKRAAAKKQAGGKKKASGDRKARTSAAARTEKPRGRDARAGRAAAAPLSNLRHLDPAARARAIVGFADLERDSRQLLEGLARDLSPLPGGSGGDFLERMVENVAGWFPLPLGFAPYFLVNGKEYVVPMVVEEPSVIAAAANAAKMARPGGGFQARCGRSILVGQVEIRDLASPMDAARAILSNEATIILHAEPFDSSLRERGGGITQLQVRLLQKDRRWATADSLGELPQEAEGDRLLVHLLVDTVDAMGANAVNIRCEAAAEKVAELTGGRVGLRILSNYSPHRMASARAVWTAQALGGKDVPGLIVEAYELAASDPYRAVTHNKGIMNGIDALLLATGNDWRAVEAAAHNHASMSGTYTSLSRFRVDAQGNLVGRLELPLAVGIVGGATKANPVARMNLEILGVRKASQLAEIAVSLGLAQNLAALRALATEGIQAGHMRLHKRLDRG